MTCPLVNDAAAVSFIAVHYGDAVLAVHLPALKRGITFAQGASTPGGCGVDWLSEDVAELAQRCSRQPASSAAVPPNPR